LRELTKKYKALEIEKNNYKLEISGYKKEIRKNNLLGKIED